MAMATQVSNPNWGRWPQQLHEYNMMDTQGMMPYDARSSTTGSLPRPVMAQPYVMAPSYNSAPMNTMQSPQYPGSSPYGYASYAGSQPTAPPAPHFRQDHAHKDHRGGGFDEHIAHSSSPTGLAESRPPLPEYPAHTPAESRHSSVCSTSQPGGSCPTANAKNITFNKTYNPEDQIDFQTDVDQLMKAIQSKNGSSDDDNQQPLTPAQTPKAETDAAKTSPASTISSLPAPSSSKPAKKWFCNGPGCNKSFVQKTHLDIHQRTHTGARPYVCKIDGCGLTFSQRGNLRTHERRHTGEKPFPCRYCGKCFAQRGNVRSHEQTHAQLKPYICKLDNCHKTFSQLGNMKTHQNNFHKQALQDLTSTFVRYAATGEVPEAHKDLFEYFREHYKNSNKGIKGRGKSRSVGPKKVKANAKAPQTPTSTSQYSQSGLSSPQSNHDQTRLPIGISVQQQQQPPPHEAGHPTMVDHQLPRVHHPGTGYQMYEPQHGSIQHHHNMLYHGEQAHQVPMGGRLY